MLPSLDPAAALVVAHPGHELRVHHWLELTRPFVIVLTDGSGHSGQSRLASTTRVLAAAGARPDSRRGCPATRHERPRVRYQVRVLFIKEF
jgi:hypothetical protein